jgi:hypothetical protein
MYFFFQWKSRYNARHPLRPYLLSYERRLFRHNANRPRNADTTISLTVSSSKSEKASLNLT